MSTKGRYRLIIKQGPVPGKVFELAKQVITIGRDVKNDFVINDAEVSRSHVRLTLQSDGVLVEDLASTNGAFINGQRITNAKSLRPGDVLGLGETVLMDFVFVPDPEATVITPPMDITPPPMPPAGVKPAPGAGRVSTAFDAPTTLPPEKSRNTLLIGAGVGCGCLVLLACVGLAALAIYVTANPDLLRSLGLGG
jgi:predicted component of type VI protein secretion system